MQSLRYITVEAEEKGFDILTFLKEVSQKVKDRRCQRFSRVEAKRKAIAESDIAKRSSWEFNTPTNSTFLNCPVLVSDRITDENAIVGEIFEGKDLDTTPALLALDTENPLFKIKAKRKEVIAEKDIAKVSSWEYNTQESKSTFLNCPVLVPDHRFTGEESTIVGTIFEGDVLDAGPALTLDTQIPALFTVEYRKLSFEQFASLSSPSKDYTVQKPVTSPFSLSKDSGHLITDEINWELTLDDSYDLYDSDTFFYLTFKFRMLLARNVDNSYSFLITLLNNPREEAQSIYVEFTANRFLREPFTRGKKCTFSTKTSYKGFKRFIGNLSNQRSLKQDVN